jgi:hypothetical protein
MEGKPTPINSVAIVQTNTEDIVGELDLVAMTKGVLIEKLAVLRGGPTTLYESWAREFEQRMQTEISRCRANSLGGISRCDAGLVRIEPRQNAPTTFVLTIPDGIPEEVVP